ncbi:MAG: hypothetical protein GY715_09285 [Planctomycetes bacterium]|nr:hypothetical protein [Planctomycetota bacterium]
MGTSAMRRGRATLLVIVSIAAVSTLTSLLARSTIAFPNYGQGGCIQCHGDFDGPVSLSGSVFPQDSKHEMHLGAGNMNTDCDLCHTTFGDDPAMNTSAGTPSTPGLGCAGCHGRDEGAGLGVLGAGLRRIHTDAGIAFCAQCHPDDPQTLVGEDVLPPYYGSPDTNVDSSCNVGGTESWTLNDDRGLDNDGDGLYDGDDPDCGVPCPEDLSGNGQVDFADILVIISAWGPCGVPCPEDLSGNGQVDFADILAVIAAWGPC